MRHWNKLPRAMIMTPNLQEFKKHLDKLLDTEFDFSVAHSSLGCSVVLQFLLNPELGMKQNLNWYRNSAVLFRGDSSNFTTLSLGSPRY